jgi:phenylalanyl-tRNA synthetase beta chain
MKLAYKHIINALGEKPSIDALSQKLFQLGHEHEIENDIFDVEFTPNRGDCLSLVGISRDLGVFYKRNHDFLKFYEDPINKLDINFINEQKNKCPNISFLNIEISGDISQYKDYLEDYFIDLNINKNNFFADVSNYISYEMGQPTHCYDKDALGHDLILKDNPSKSLFTTLLGQKIEISDGDLVFTSNDEIVNLAGIMGGDTTACKESTKNVLVECANFNPEFILGKSIKYNLQSDAAHKFERGTDPKCHEDVLRRFVQIVSDHTSINKLEIYSLSSSTDSIKLDFNPDLISKILGTQISQDNLIKSLTGLGFEVNDNIIIPSYRNDISHQNDLAEEVARVLGYDNIPVKNFVIKNGHKKNNKLSKFNEEAIKFFLVENGFSEVINSSFTPQSTPVSIKVDNPLDINRKYFRTNLTSSLIENVLYNEKRQQDSIKLFEISDIYSIKDDLIKERRIALIISGRQGHNYFDFAQKLDKKYFKNLFSNMGINDVETNIVTVDRNKIASKVKTPIFAVELSIKDLFDNTIQHQTRSNLLEHFVKYQSISEYPSSYRDLSISIKDSDFTQSLNTTIQNIESPLIKERFVFDFFENVKNQEIKIGYRFVFQSHIKTLTDVEIDAEMQLITKAILSIKSVSIPGLKDSN